VPVRVFVYGSLRKGFGNHGRFLGAARFVGEARTPAEYTMGSLGGFPGVCKGGLTPIAGEIYELTAEAQLEWLDRLEGHPRFYCRELIAIDGGARAWIYLLPDGHVRELPRVESGDWKQHQTERGMTR
jgi:gamma-glutamylcyclotransferase (GGCT)/AIG2-like uncharacterized protein YtfP